MSYQDLRVEEVSVPAVGPRQMRITVHCADMSFATSPVTQGRYQRKPPLPFTPGTEVAGVIEEMAPVENSPFFYPRAASATPVNVIASANS